MCGTSDQSAQELTYVDVGQLVGNLSVSSQIPGTSVGHVKVNSGMQPTQSSDFAIMELMTWERVLSSAEILATMQYLNGKTMGWVSGSTTQWPWWSCSWVPLPSPSLRSFDNVTYQPYLNNGQGYYTLLSTAAGGLVVQIKQCDSVNLGLPPGTPGSCVPNPSWPTSTPLVVRGLAVGGTLLSGNTLIIYANAQDGGVTWNGVAQTANASFGNSVINVTYNDPTTGSWIYLTVSNLMTIRIWNRGSYGGGNYLTAEVWLNQQAVPFTTAVFSESFNSFTGGGSGTQLITNLPVQNSASAQNWTGTGLHVFHWVSRTMTLSGDTALMVYADNVATSTACANCNAAGTQYLVTFQIAPAQYATTSQATQTGDGIVFTITDARGNIVATQTVVSGNFATSQAFVSQSFTYVGNGNGAVTVKLSSNNASSGRFAGAIDNLIILTQAAGPSQTQTGLCGNFNYVANDYVSTASYYPMAWSSSSNLFSSSLPAGTPVFVVPLPFSDPSFPTPGLISWFRGESATNTSWPDMVGGYTASYGPAGTVTVNSGCDNYACSYISGPSTTNVTFGAILADAGLTYTICSVTKYNGKTQGRILQGSKGAWVHGHRTGYNGMANYGNGWITNVTANPTILSTLPWTAQCGSADLAQLQMVYVDVARNTANLTVTSGQMNGQQVGNVFVNNLTVGYSPATAGDINSDWAILEIITWNRVLNSTEITNVMTYLSNKAWGYQNLPTTGTNWWHCQWRPLSQGGTLTTFDNNTYAPFLMVGAGFYQLLSVNNGSEVIQIKTCDSMTIGANTGGNGGTCLPNPNANATTPLVVRAIAIGGSSLNGTSLVIYANVGDSPAPAGSPAFSGVLLNGVPQTPNVNIVSGAVNVTWNDPVAGSWLFAVFPGMTVRVWNRGAYQGGNYITAEVWIKHNSTWSQTGLCGNFDGVTANSPGSYFPIGWASPSNLFLQAAQSVTTFTPAQFNNPASLSTATGVWSQAGTSSTFVAPNGVAVDNSGAIYVVDGGTNRRVLKFSAGSVSAAAVYGQSSVTATGPTQIGPTSSVSCSVMNLPTDVAVDSSGGVYISDAGWNRILFFPNGYTQTATRVYGQASCSISTPPPVSASSLNSPQGLTLDNSGNLYVADTGNNRVLVFGPANTTAKAVYGQGGSFASFASSCTASGLNSPYGVALDSSANLYVADFGNNRVLVFPNNNATAAYAIGQTGLTSCSCMLVSNAALCGPMSVDVDRLNSKGVYVADYYNSRVLFFSYPCASSGCVASGVFGQTSFTANTTGAANAQLNHPADVAVDFQGNLYVADLSNNRVLNFSATLKAGAATTSNSGIPGLPQASAYLGEFSATPPALAPPTSGIFSWFASTSATATSWPSIIGPFTATVGGTLAPVSGDQCGNYKCGNYLTGTNSSTINFGYILPSAYTICSVTKYNGPHTNRILQSSTHDWTHGHNGSLAGQANYGSGPISSASANNSKLPWLAMCGSFDGNSSQQAYVDVGLMVGTIGATQWQGPALGTIQVNAGWQAQWTSDFAIMEVITWDHALVPSDMTLALSYLSWKSMGYQNSMMTVAPSWRCYWNPLSGNGAPSLVTFDNSTRTPYLNDGAGIYQLISVAGQKLLVQIKSCDTMTSGVNNGGTCSPNPQSATTTPLTVRGIAIGGSWLNNNTLVIYANTGDGGVIYKGVAQQANVSFSDASISMSVSYNDVLTGSWLYAVFANMTVRVWLRGTYNGGLYMTAEIWLQHNGLASSWTQTGLCGNFDYVQGDYPSIFWPISWSSQKNLFMTGGSQPGTYSATSIPGNGWSEPAFDTTFPLGGVIAWYRSDQSNATSWSSLYGGFSAVFSTSATWVVGAKCDNYICGNYISGNASMTVDFGPILGDDSMTYTICSITKYNGANFGRILQGSNGWLHGHWKSATGQANYGSGFLTNSATNTTTMPWLVMCGTADQTAQQQAFVDLGTLVATLQVVQQVSGPAVGNIFVNKGNYTNETSDWAIMEIITWDRVLTYPEIFNVMSYLSGKTMGYVASPTSVYPFWHCLWRPLVNNATTLTTFDNKTWSPLLNVGAGFYTLLSSTNPAVVIQAKSCDSMTSGVNNGGTCSANPNASTTTPLVVRAIAIGGTALLGNSLVIYANAGDGWGGYNVFLNGVPQPLNVPINATNVNVTWNNPSTGAWITVVSPNVTVTIWFRGWYNGGNYLTGEIWLNNVNSSNHSGLCGNYDYITSNDAAAFNPAFYPIGWASSSNLFLQATQIIPTAAVYATATSAGATIVYGQASLTTGVSKTDQTGFMNANGVTVDNLGGIYVVDGPTNRRVLYFPPRTGNTVPAPTLVWGQTSVSIGGIVNASTQPSCSIMNSPADVAIDMFGGVYISDSAWHRVLYFANGNFATATTVYGQSGSCSSVLNGAPAAGSLNAPQGLIVDSLGGLYIADTNNNRVVYYPAGVSNAATKVFGQALFTTGTAASASATSLNQPFGLALDKSGNLYVADKGNNRVLYYNLQASSYATAVGVYGQASFTTSASSPVSASSMNGPTAVDIDRWNSNAMFVADTGNNRVLYFSSPTTSQTGIGSAASGTLIFGQTTATGATAGSPISASSLSSPQDVAVDMTGNIYIADTGNNRILLYPSTKTSGISTSTTSTIPGFTLPSTPGGSALPAAGLYSWFTSNSAPSAGNWPSQVGLFQAVFGGTGSPSLVTGDVCNNYACGNYVQGSSTTTVNFGPILPTAYTICSITKYQSTTGTSKGRILQTSAQDWCHGQCASTRGQANYGSGAITNSSWNTSNLTWLTMCGTADQVAFQTAYVDVGILVGNLSSQSQVPGFSLGKVAVNAAGFQQALVSDWAIMELLTWDRALTQQEIVNALSYLSWKTIGYQSLQTTVAPWWECSWLDRQNGQTAIVTFDNTTYQTNLVDGAGYYQLLSVFNGSLTVQVKSCDTMSTGALNSGACNPPSNLASTPLTARAVAIGGSWLGGATILIFANAGDGVLISNTPYQFVYTSAAGAQQGVAVGLSASPAIPGITLSWSDTTTSSWLYVASTNFTLRLWLKNTSTTGSSYLTGEVWLQHLGSGSQWVQSGLCGNFNYQDDGAAQPVFPISWASSSNLFMTSLATYAWPQSIPGLSKPSVDATFPTGGLIAWFQSSSSTSSGWPSTVGPFKATYAGTVSINSNSLCDNYVCGQFISGNSTASVDFGYILGDLANTFTICSATKYFNANSRGRIIQGASGAMVHGHWNSNNGVANYGNGWITATKNNSNLQWLVMCGSSDQVAYQTAYVDIGSSVANASASSQLSGPQVGDVFVNINKGSGTNASEFSDFAIMEVITWDRVLAPAELTNVMSYLNGKTIGYQTLTPSVSPFPWWHCSIRPLGFVTPIVTFDNATYTPYLNGGSGFFQAVYIPNGGPVVQVKSCDSMFAALNGQSLCTSNPNAATSTPLVVRGIAASLGSTTLVIYGNTNDGGVLVNGQPQTLNTTFNSPSLNLTWNDPTTGSWIYAVFSTMTIRVWNRGWYQGGYYLTADIWLQNSKTGTQGLCGNFNYVFQDSPMSFWQIPWASTTNLFQTGQSSTLVAPTYTNSGSNIPTTIYGNSNCAVASDNTGFRGANGVAVDSWGGLYVADGALGSTGSSSAGNYRVLYFSPGNNSAPSAVYGQTSTGSSVQPLSVSCSVMNTPTDIATDGIGGVYIADAAWNRILYFPPGATTATRVYGQTSCSLSGASTSNQGLYQPMALTVDSTGGLYVADSGNHRVLYFPAGLTIASIVYGQTSMTANSTNAGGAVRNVSLSGPQGVSLDSTGKLYVADTGNNRVLVFPSGSTAATIVYGQTSFSGVAASATASTLNKPTGIDIDRGNTGGIYIADSGNNRVLFFSSPATSNGAAATSTVYGQSTLTSSSASGCSATGLNNPQDVAVDSIGGLYVADMSNARVLYYPSKVVTGITTTPTPANQVPGMSTPTGVPSTGLMAWYLNPSSNLTWQSKVGTLSANMSGSGLNVVTGDFCDNYLCPNYMAGTPNSTIDFGPIVGANSGVYTICSATTYMGNSTGVYGTSFPAGGRILQNLNGNWIHGHWNNTKGVANYGNGWLPPATSGTAQFTWLVMCGSSDLITSQLAYVDLGKVAANLTVPGYNQVSGQNVGHIIIGPGKWLTETSYFAVMEVLAWDRVLSVSEISAVMAYLNKKTNGYTGAATEQSPYWRCYFTSMQNTFGYHVMTFDNKSYTPYLSSPSGYHTGYFPLISTPDGSITVHVRSCDNLTLVANGMGQCWNRTGNNPALAVRGIAVSGTLLGENDLLVFANNGDGGITWNSQDITPSSPANVTNGSYMNISFNDPVTGSWLYAVFPNLTLRLWTYSYNGLTALTGEVWLARNPAIVTSGLCGNYNNVIGDDTTSSFNNLPFDTNNLFMTSLVIPPWPGANLVPTNGLVSWFRSERAFNFGWVSKVGALGAEIEIVASYNSGVVNVVPGDSCNLGLQDNATQCPSYIAGNPSASVDFGPILGTGDWTICSVTKYNGAHQNRILTGNNTNWLHGQWNGLNGVAYYGLSTGTNVTGGWVTNNSGSLALMPWTVACGTVSNTFVYNVDNCASCVTTVAHLGGGVVGHVVVNQGSASTDQGSDWAIMEIITWSRALNKTEIVAATSYLNLKTQNYLYGNPSQAFPWWHCVWNDLQSSTGANVVTFDNVSYTPSLMTGATFFTLLQAGTTTIQAKSCYNMTVGLQGTGLCQEQPTTQSDPLLVRGIAVNFSGQFLVVYANAGDGGVTWNNQQQTGNFSNSYVSVTYNDYATGSWMFVNFTTMTIRLYLLGPSGGGYYLSGEIWQHGPGSPQQGLCGNFDGVAANSPVTYWPIGWADASNVFMNSLLLPGSAKQNPYPAVPGIPLPPGYPSFPTVGLFSWFRSDKATNVSWPSLTGPFNATYGGTTGVSLVTGDQCDNYVCANYISGNSTSTINFGMILPASYTICTISRYTGSITGRILQASGADFAHGHHNGFAGVANYGGTWLNTSSSSTSTYTWLVMCGTSSAQAFVDVGKFVGSTTTFTTTSGQLLGNITVNQGWQPAMVSNFAIMEVITWSRILANSEIFTVMQYLSGKSAGYVPMPSTIQPWWHCFTRPLNGPYGNNIMTFDNATFTPNLNSGAGYYTFINANAGAIIVQLKVCDIFVPGINGTGTCQSFTGSSWPLSVRGVAISGTSLKGQSLVIYSETGDGGVILNGATQPANVNITSANINVTWNDAVSGSWIYVTVSGMTIRLWRRGPYNKYSYLTMEAFLSQTASQTGICGNFDSLLTSADTAAAATSFFPLGWASSGNTFMTTQQGANAQVIPGFVQPTGYANFPAPGLFSWFRSDQSSTSNWTSLVGGFVAVYTGTVSATSTGVCDNYVCGTFISGSSSATINFGAILPATYTICSVSQYAGSQNVSSGRILQGQSSDWLHGHANGQVGVANYGTWITPNTSNSNFNWLVMCGSSDQEASVDVGRFVGNNTISQQVSQTSGNVVGNVTVNFGMQASQTSAWNIMEVITWDRILSVGEVYNVEAYLSKKTIGYVATSSTQYPWWRCYWAAPTGSASGNPVMTFDNVSFVPSLGSSAGYYTLANGNSGYEIIQVKICDTFVPAGQGQSICQASMTTPTQLPVRGIAVSGIGVGANNSLIIYAESGDGGVIFNGNPQTPGVAITASGMTLSWNDASTNSWIYAQFANLSIRVWKRGPYNGYAYLTAEVYMNRQPSQSGLCGNFNQLQANEAQPAYPMSWASLGNIFMNPKQLGLSALTSVPGIAQPALTTNFPTVGLFSWFRSDMATTTNWTSLVGGFVATYNGTVTLAVNDSCDNVVCGNYITGSNATRINFGSILSNNYTICSVTKYNGANRGRILQGTSNLFVHGHNAGLNGQANYGTAWITNSSANTSFLSWLVMCGTTDQQVWVDVNNFVGKPSSLQSSGNAIGNISVNLNGANSDFAIMEVITWDRILATQEILNVLAYLGFKTIGYVASPAIQSPSPSAWSWRCVWRPLTTTSKSGNQMTTFDNISYVPLLGSGGGYYPLLNLGMGSLVIQLKICDTFVPGYNGSGVCRGIQGSAAPMPVRGVAIGGTLLPASLIVYAEAGDGGVIWNGTQLASTTLSNFSVYNTVYITINETSTNAWMVITTANFVMRLWKRSYNGYAYFTGEVYLAKSPIINGMCGNYNGIQGDSPSSYFPFGWANAGNLFMLAQQSGYNSVPGLTTPVGAPNFPLGGLYSWFRSESSTTSNWPSPIGSWIATYNGTVTVTVNDSCDNYLCGTYIGGKASTNIVFGPILPAVYTICTISRYNASNRGRIFQSDTVDWVHGHYNGLSGQAYYGAWLTNNSKNTSQENWLVMCGAVNQQAYVDVDEFVGNSTATMLAAGTTVGNVVVNSGFQQAQISDFNIMEVITWDRILNDTEMFFAMAYLNSKTIGYVATPRTMYPWWRCMWKPVESPQGPNIVTYDNTSYPPNLPAGAGFYQLVNIMNGGLVIQIKICDTMVPQAFSTGLCAWYPSSSTAAMPLAVRGIAIGGTWIMNNTLAIYANQLDGGIVFNSFTQNSTVHNINSSIVNISYNESYTGAWLVANFTNVTLRLWLRGPYQGGYYFSAEVWLANIGVAYGGFDGVQSGLCGNYDYVASGSSAAFMPMPWTDPSNMFMVNPMNGTSVVPGIYAPPGVPTIGLAAWFCNLNLSTSVTTTNWTSRAGQYTAVFAGGTPTLVTGDACDNYICGNYITGTKGMSIDFGWILPYSYTICSITKYNGPNKYRIIQGGSGFAHGHWNGFSAQGNYGAGWVTSTTQSNSNATWLVMCGTSDQQVVVDVEHYLTTGPSALMTSGMLGGDININLPGKKYSNESSDWAVMEVMTWMRVLSTAEMINVTAYLNRYTTGYYLTNTTWMPWWKCFWKPLGASTGNNLMTFDNTSYVPVMGTGSGYYWLTNVQNGALVVQAKICDKLVPGLLGQGSCTGTQGNSNPWAVRGIAIGGSWLGTGNSLIIYANAGDGGVLLNSVSQATNKSFATSWVNVTYNDNVTKSWIFAVFTNLTVRVWLRPSSIPGDTYNYMSAEIYQVQQGGQQTGLCGNYDYKIGDVATNPLAWPLPYNSGNNVFMTGVQQNGTYNTSRDVPGFSNTVPSVPSIGLNAWFKAGTATATSWTSQVGKWTATFGGSQPALVQNDMCDNYVCPNYISGSSTSTIDFGPILPSVWTICTITKYGGGNNYKRILQANNTNWVHGQWSGMNGMANYGTAGWLTGTAGTQSASYLNWLVMCGTIDQQVIIDIGTRVGNTAGSPNQMAGSVVGDVVVNLGMFANESSDWAIMEIITWDRILTPTEIQNVISYMSFSTMGYVYSPQTTWPWWRCSTIPLATTGPNSGYSQIVTFDNNTFPPTLEDGAGFYSLVRLTDDSMMIQVMSCDGYTPPLLQGIGLGTYKGSCTGSTQAPLIIRGIAIGGSAFGGANLMIQANTEEGGVTWNGTDITGNFSNSYLNVTYAPGMPGGLWMTVYLVQKNLFMKIFMQAKLRNNFKYLTTELWMANPIPPQTGLCGNWNFIASDTTYVSTPIPRSSLHNMFTAALISGCDGTACIPLNGLYMWYSSGAQVFGTVLGTQTVSWQDNVNDSNSMTVLVPTGLNTLGTGVGFFSSGIYMIGTEASGVVFGKMPDGIFTICTATRYTGTNATFNNRIIQGSPGNFFHGHYSGGIQRVADYNNTWFTNYSGTSGNPTDWIYMCGSNNGSVMATYPNNTCCGDYFYSGGNPAITGNWIGQTLNIGATYNLTSENSRFAVAEIEVWNRALSQSEMMSAILYMMANVPLVSQSR